MNLSEQLDVLEDELGIEPLEMQCDGCTNTFTRHDERYSRYVEPMVMVLCPTCAKQAGWLDDD